MEREARAAEEEEAAEREGQTPILVIKVTQSKAVFAHACPCKGAHEAVVARVVADLNVLGIEGSWFEQMANLHFLICGPRCRRSGRERL